MPTDDTNPPQRPRSLSDELDPVLRGCNLDVYMFVPTPVPDVSLLEACGQERWFTRREASDLPVSAAVITSGAHERVHLWDRGRLEGYLLVMPGDGERVTAALGLVETVA